MRIQCSLYISFLWPAATMRTSMSRVIFLLNFANCLIEWDAVGGRCFGFIVRTDIVKFLKFFHHLLPFGNRQKHRLGMFIFINNIFRMNCNHNLISESLLLLCPNRCRNPNFYYPPTRPAAFASLTNALENTAPTEAKPTTFKKSLRLVIAIMLPLTIDDIRGLAKFDGRSVHQQFGGLGGHFDRRSSNSTGCGLPMVSFEKSLCAGLSR
jgi:hypothetical protein